MNILRQKIEFGSQRVQRWFHRFERFNFDIVYRKGEDLITADALSRSVQAEINYMESSKEANASIEVINFHMQMNHRKKIKADLAKKVLRCRKQRLKVYLINALYVKERTGRTEKLISSLRLLERGKGSPSTLWK